MNDATNSLKKHQKARASLSVLKNNDTKLRGCVYESFQPGWGWNFSPPSQGEIGVQLHESFQVFSLR